MTAIARISRVAVAVALGLTAPLVLRTEAALAAPVALTVAGARLAVAESAPVGPTHRAVRRPVTDTSARRERGRSEHPPATPRRRAPKAKSGAATSPQPAPNGQYVPDQPWETEFFVSNRDVMSHSRLFRLASTNGN